MWGTRERKRERKGEQQSDTFIVTVVAAAAAHWIEWTKESSAVSTNYEFIRGERDPRVEIELPKNTFDGITKCGRQPKDL